MAGAGYRVELDGGDAAIARLSAIVAGLDHAQPLFAEIGAYLVAATEHRFETGIDPEGNPWPPSLRVIAHGGKTMIESTRLLRSLTFNAWDSGVEAGTNVIYAAIHQFGGDIVVPARTQTLHFKIDKRSGEVGSKFVKKSKSNFAQDAAVGEHTVHMPRRAFLGLDNDDEAELISIGEDYLARLEGGGSQGSEGG